MKVTNPLVRRLDLEPIRPIAFQSDLNEVLRVGILLKLQLLLLLHFTHQLRRCNLLNRDHAFVIRYSDWLGLVLVQRRVALDRDR